MVFKPGHHTPPHFFMADWFYMLTGSIYRQQPLMQSNDRKKEWVDALFIASELYQWEIIAWVVMDNHYHTILKSPEKSSGNLPKFVASYHKFTAHQWNNEEELIGRKVWWNYWDTCIRSQDDYLTRLRYVFWNPVKHGLVKEPADYPYSNYDDFLEEDWFDLGKIPIEVENVPEF
jgi:putative transposase